jgi:hypothetical protein
MNQYLVKFRIITADNKLIPSEQTVSANDRTSALRIVESLYPKINVINITIK